MNEQDFNLNNTNNEKLISNYTIFDFKNNRGLYNLILILLVLVCVFSIGYNIYLNIQIKNSEVDLQKIENVKKNELSENIGSNNIKPIPTKSQEIKIRSLSDLTFDYDTSLYSLEFSPSDQINMAQLSFNSKMENKNPLLVIRDLKTAANYDQNKTIEDFFPFNPFNGQIKDRIIKKVTFLGKQYSFMTSIFASGGATDPKTGCSEGGGAYSHLIMTEDGFLIDITDSFSDIICFKDNDEVDIKRTLHLTQKQIDYLLEIIETAKYIDN